MISFVRIWIRLENLIKEVKQKGKRTQCTVDVYTLQGYEERVKNYEEELLEIKWGLLSLEDTYNLEETGSTLEQLSSSLSVSIKLLIGSKGETPKKSERIDWSDGRVAAWKRTVDFPQKYDQVENFLGAIWEQRHYKPQLTDSDRLAYLRDALKDCPAKKHSHWVDADIVDL